VPCVCATSFLMDFFFEAPWSDLPCVCAFSDDVLSLSTSPPTGKQVFLGTGDIAGLPTLRANVKSLPGNSFCFAISTCLCLSCAVSEPGGAGLGTLGFTVPVAMDMLTANGFNNVKVVSEEGGTRWFEAIAGPES